MAVVSAVAVSALRAPWFDGSNASVLVEVPNGVIALHKMSEYAVDASLGFVTVELPAEQTVKIRSLPRERFRSSPVRRRGSR